MDILPTNLQILIHMVFVLSEFVHNGSLIIYLLPPSYDVILMSL